MSDRRRFNFLTMFSQFPLKTQCYDVNKSLSLSLLQNFTSNDTSPSSSPSRQATASEIVPEGKEKKKVVDVAFNNLFGYIPSSLGIPSSLHVLKMNNNNFGGEIPSSFQNCSDLMDIDLGGNKLTGKLPSWIASELHHLQILKLSSNLLSGHIPTQLCNLQMLQIQDVGHNNFSGTIPTCLNNLTYLIMSGGKSWPLYDDYNEETTIISKGRELEYGMTNTILMQVTSIDLSSNNLDGDVPKEICSLIALGTLNLSRNQLTGKIPSPIGKLTQLETLDLSHNHLSGEILQSMSSLNFLSHLNLSYNNLRGRIPSGNQLQTLDDPSIYGDNPLLCGFPLNKKTAKIMKMMMKSLVVYQRRARIHRRILGRLQHIDPEQVMEVHVFSIF
ncbi:hypothetical protein ACLB2K_031900 [Fragaria x ananassa]